MEVLGKQYCPNCMQEIEAGADLCPWCGADVHRENAPHQLQCGTVLENRYIVGSVIGQGGFGITYIGFDRRLKMRVAIKEYYPSGLVTRYHDASMSLTVTGDAQELKQFEKWRGRFIEEAQVLANFVGEPNIVSVRDYFEANDTAYIIMEYLDGESLTRYAKRVGPMSFERVYTMLAPVMDALEKVHEQGIIHRDISPSNLMILTDGRVKLLDFGTARAMSMEGEKSLSVILKPGFAPEEQYRSHGEQGPWTDVYAFSATMYKLITGKTPENAMNRHFEDTLESPSMLGADISPAAETALMRGMAVRIKDRYQSMSDLKRAFAASLRSSVADEIDGEYEDDEEVTVKGPAAVREKPEVRKPEVRQPEEKKPEVRKPEVKKPEHMHRQDEKKKFPVKIVAIAAVAVLAIILVVVFMRGGITGGKADYSFSREEVTVKRLEAIDADDTVTVMTFTGCVIDDSMMERIGSMKRIKQLDFTGCTGFTDFSPLAKLETLERLSVTANASSEELTSMDGKRLFNGSYPQIQSLLIYEADFTTDMGFLKNFPNLGSLTLYSCAIEDTAEPFPVLSSLQYVTFENTALAAWDLSNIGSCAALRSFTAKYCGLKNILFLADLAELSDVDIRGNEIETLEPLLGDVKIRDLNASGNNLKDLHGMEAKADLMSVNVRGNQITDISALEGNTAIRTVDLSSNQLTDLHSLSGCTAITELSIVGNQISDISPLSELVKMKNLYLNDNQLTNLNACEKMIELVRIQAGNNQLTDISGLTNCTQLERVYLSNNQLTDISVLQKSAGKLAYVMLDSNELTDISALSECTALYVAALEHNHLTDLNALTKCKELYSLTAQDNDLRDISGIAGMEKLYYLDLGENEIVDISPLRQTGSGKMGLILQNNSITDIGGINGTKDYLYLSLYGNEIQDLTALEAMTELSSSSKLYLAWNADADYAGAAKSGFYAVRITDVPLDQQMNLKNMYDPLKKEAINRTNTLTFMSTEEANAEIEDAREKARTALTLDIREPVKEE